MQNEMRILNTSNISVITYYPEFSTICIIGKEAFWGTIEIKYYPNDHLLEFMAFDKWLKSLALKEMTIEGLCRTVYDKVKSVLQCDVIINVKAYTNAHYPVEVKIE